jgi:hypothetical protein
MAEEDSGWALYSVDENCLNYDDFYTHSPESKRIDKWHKSLSMSATRRFIDWLIPSTLNAVFMSESIAPSAMSRGDDYYENELRSNRFAYIRGTRPTYGSHYADVIPGVKAAGENTLSYDDPRRMQAPISKIQERLYVRVKETIPEDAKEMEFADALEEEQWAEERAEHLQNGLFSFVVWTGNRADAMERARKVFYHMLGYVPFFHIYPRMYGTTTGMGLLAKGLHEDNILQGAQVVVPEGVIDLNRFDARGREINDYSLSEDERDEKIQCERDNVLHIVTNIADERPDLYE